MNKQSKGAITAIITVALLMTIAITASAVQFNDVQSEHWANPAIDYVSEKGIMTGKGDGVFDPDGKVTIGEMLAITARINGVLPTVNATDAYGRQHWAAGYYDALIREDFYPRMINELSSVDTTISNNVIGYDIISKSITNKIEVKGQDYDYLLPLAGVEDCAYYVKATKQQIKDYEFDITEGGKGYNVSTIQPYFDNYRGPFDFYVGYSSNVNTVFDSASTKGYVVDCLIQLPVSENYVEGMGAIYTSNINGVDTIVGTPEDELLAYYRGYSYLSALQHLVERDYPNASKSTKEEIERVYTLSYMISGEIGKQFNIIQQDNNVDTLSEYVKRSEVAQMLYNMRDYLD